MEAARAIAVVLAVFASGYTAMEMLGRVAGEPVSLTVSVVVFVLCVFVLWCSSRRDR